jgi:hypothetical protein
MGIDTLRIETPRLMLRPTRWEDFDAWAAFLADEESTRFLGGVQSRPRSMMCMAGAWFLGRPAMFSVIEKSTGRRVGRLGPWTPEGWPGTEVGWGIARECWDVVMRPKGPLLSSTGRSTIWAGRKSSTPLRRTILPRKEWRAGWARVTVAGKAAAAIRRPASRCLASDARRVARALPLRPMIEASVRNSIAQCAS